MEEKVNPWEVLGDVNYGKLIKDFGVSKIDEKLLKRFEKISKKNKKDLHIFLKRGLFFAHRDFEKVLEKVEKGEDIFLYTGRAPGGNMHIGHLIPFLFTKYLQEVFNCNLYIQIPDDEKFLFKEKLKLKEIDLKVQKDLEEICAFGFDENKTFIFRNSEFIKNMYLKTLEVSKKITFSQARNTFGFTNFSNVGQIFYPSLQIVPTFFEKNLCLIPCAIDQNPYFMLQRDFAEKIGGYKNSTILSKFLPPLTGVCGKMSASDESKAILLIDDKKTIKKKIEKYCFSGGGKTLEEHKEFGGNCEVDVAYNWLYFLFEDDDKKIFDIKKKYENGELLSSDLKKILINEVCKFLDAHNKKKILAKKTGLLDKYMKSGKLAKKMWRNFF